MLLITSLLCLGLLEVATPGAAIAAVRSLEEVPGQIVYQSRQTVKDQRGYSWQAIAFKRLRADGQTTLHLRLVGFPGAVTIEHGQPLRLTNSLGKALTAVEADSPTVANVGEYDLLPVLSQLQPELPLQLTIPTVIGEGRNLWISPFLVREWQTLSDLQRQN